jgi:large subunit ribosomal protein L35
MPLGSPEKPHMAKMKSNRAAAKRFKLTGKGRVRRPKAGGQHLLGGKSRKLRRRRRNNAIVSPALEKRVRNMLPYG